MHLYRRTRINSIVGRCPIWFVREAPRHRVSGYALAAALAAPAVRFEYPALQHSALGRQVLPYRLEAELIEAAEQGQIWCKESRLGHVEVFRMGSVRTSILRETSTPIRSATRSTDYTLVREEPRMWLRCQQLLGRRWCLQSRVVRALVDDPTGPGPPLPV